MPIANQGFRQDLNFLENTNDTLALANLGGVGLADDLRIIQNNLRNTSRLPFNSVKLDTDEFVFTTDKVVAISAISSEPDPDVSNASRITVTLATPYHTYADGLVTVDGVTGAGNTIFNGGYPAVLIGAGGTNVTYRKTNCLFTGSGQDVSSATITYTSNTNAVYTNDDVVTVSESVSVGSTTLNAGTRYFICNSDAITKFKLSFTPSIVGISTIDVSATPSQFNFIKDEPVLRFNLEQFIKPEIQDTINFGSFLRGTINGILSGTQTKIENSNYFIAKKYKGTENTTVDTVIKTEGTINLFDPGNFNSSSAAVGSDFDTVISPGIFIGGTRAFSADNNPWSITDALGVADAAGTFLTTSSEEVSIGDLLFGDGITIDGINVTTSTDGKTAESFTHKVPIVVNGETYYLLMTP
tara:strand:- start:6267 stop:7505 length:1239 start_codon:yes stop_codon:yes gene_type:complete